MATENTDDLAFESATNRRYLTRSPERLGRPIQVTVSANEKWIENIPRTGLTFDDFGPLVARVGLTQRTYPFVGRAFYIGARWLSEFDDPVVSWDAPVAKIFYEPDASTHEFSDRVIVRRTFLERNRMRSSRSTTPGKSEVAPGQSPFVARQLDVPAAPRAVRATPPLGVKSGRDLPRRQHPQPPATAQRRSRPASRRSRLDDTSEPGAAKERLRTGHAVCRGSRLRAASASKRSAHLRPLDAAARPIPAGDPPRRCPAHRPRTSGDGKDDHRHPPGGVSRESRSGC